MPRYQYACTECGHQFETVQSFSDDALTECPQCTGRLRKVFNAVGIVFKGSGFYRTDSRKGSSGDSGSSGSTSAGTSDSTSGPSETGSSTASGSPSTSGSSTSSGSTSTSSSTAGSAA